MKKLSLLFLTLVMAVTLAACGGETTEEPAAPTLEDGISAFTDKYNTAVDLVNESATAAEANGWQADEAFISELDASIKLLDLVAADLENPENIDEAYLAELNATFDELIPTWESYLTQVSEPYVAQ